jgi:hypothetical protein
LQASASPPTDSFLPSQVQPGQKAYGLTVFEGDKVERFELVLLGVLENFLGPQQDLVIARLADPKLQEAGVVAGMSGSPVYVDGKLVGALGYALGAFMREGICGITPIAAMRKVRDLPKIDPFALTSNEKTFAGETIHPISAPLQMSGIDPQIAQHFAATFEALGFVTSPAGSSSNHASRPLEPGASVAAELVRGDVSIAATGTVTTVDGNKVLAFGHPFMGIGPSSFPMAASRVITIVPSLQRSFKLGQTEEVIGSFTQDRLTAIAGQIGLKADTVPVTVEVAAEPEKDSHTYRYELARDPKLTPDLLQLVLANSFMRRTEAGLFGTAEVETSFALTDGTTLKWLTRVSMDRDQSLPVTAALSVSRPAEILWHNDFGPPLLRSVSVKATLSREVKGITVETLSVRPNGYAAGEAMHLRVGTRSPAQPIKFHDVVFTLPRGLEPGDYDLMVGGAPEANGTELRVGGFLRPQTAPALIAALAAIRPDGPLYVMLTGHGGSLRVGEALVSNPPLTFAQQAGPRDGDSRTQQSTLAIFAEKSVDLGAFVMGGAQATLRVRKNN